MSEWTTEMLKHAICETMSPEAVALMIANLQGVTCANSDANIMVEWFVARLIEVVGGPEAMDNLYEEIGV